MTNDALERMVPIRLWDELIIRNRFVFIPQLLISLISLAVCYDLHVKNSWSLVCHVLIFIGCIVRNYVLQLKMPNALPSRKIALFYYLCVLCLASGWSLLFFLAQRHYGEFSPQSTFFYMILAGQCSAGVTTFSPHPRGYFFFILPMIIITIIQPFLSDQTHALLFSALIIFVSVFFLYQLRLAHNYIVKSIKHELALTFEKEKLESLINAVPGFVSFIGNDLRYLAINDFGRTYYKAEDLIGKTVGFMHPNSEFSTFVHEFMRDSKETKTREMDIIFKNITKTFIVSIKKIYQPTGGAVIVSVPMDELVEAREHLKIQEAKSFYTAKLVSLGEMAAGIAHEINNPLAIIQGSSDQMEKILQRRDFEVSKIIDYNTKIQKTVDRISRIIKSLKGLARNGENDPFVHFHFQSILDPCIEINRQRFRDQNVNLEIVPFDTSFEITGQEIQLTQVLMNLLNNAFDAAIETAASRWVRIELVTTDQFYDIMVQDSGNGIPKGIRNKIMEPFFTTKPVNKGTGLGLSISKNIMEKHGGILILDDSYPHTTFIMRFYR